MQNNVEIHKLQNSLNAFCSDFSLKRYIKNQFMQRKIKGSQEKYFINQIAQICKKNKGLISTSRQKKFDKLMDKFQNTHTFVRVKEIVQQLNILNSTQTVNKLKKAYESQVEKLRGNRLYQQARNIQFGLPNDKILKRTNFKLKKMSSARNAREHQFLSKRVKLIEQQLNAQISTEDKPQLVLPEDQRQNDDNMLFQIQQQSNQKQIIEQRIKQLQILLQQRKKAQRNPQNYFKKYSSRANKFLDQLSKTLNKLRVRSENKVSRSIKFKTMKPKTTGQTKLIHSSSKNRFNMTSSTNRDSKFRNRILQEVKLLIQTINNDEYVFKKQKRALNGLLLRLQKQQNQELASAVFSSANLEFQNPFLAQ